MANLAAFESMSSVSGGRSVFGMPGVLSVLHGFDSYVIQTAGNVSAVKCCIGTPLQSGAPIKESHSRSKSPNLSLHHNHNGVIHHVQYHRRGKPTTPLKQNGVANSE